MSSEPSIEALRRRVAELEAELERVRPIEAAAREAYAFFAGRRPGFAPSYARDVILAAFEASPRRGSKQARPPQRRRQT